MNVDNVITYLDFVAERHRIWEARQAGEPQPWTEDPILRIYKFTNMFRVLDPGSQFVFELARPDDDPRDVFTRLFLYRYTNLPAAWRAYAMETGEYPGADDLNELQAFWDGYRLNGGQLFSGAYMILPQPNRSGDKMHQAIELTRRVVKQSYTEFTLAAKQIDRLDTLRGHYGVGDFMAMQILTDWGYTAQCGEDRENEFIIPGPGSTRGARLLQPGQPVNKTIAECQHLVHMRLDCPELGTRLPSLMDIQNTLCEYSKYERYRTKPALPVRGYKPAHPGPQEAPTLPAHWL